MHRQQPACDQPLGRWRADPKADVDPLVDPVGDAVVQLHVGFDLRMPRAELFQHRPQQLQHGRARRHDAQRPGDLFLAATRAVQRALQRGQPWLCTVEEAAAFFGQAQSPRGAMKQAHAQVRFELRQRLAGGLRRDRLRG
ncbi:MAG: hypothetical protein Q7U22_19095, partial [Pararhizobium sp.]